MNSNTAITSMLGGFFVWAIWILFIHVKESSALGVCQAIFGKPSLAAGSMIAYVDPIIIALPISACLAIIGTFVTKNKL